MSQPAVTRWIFNRIYGERLLDYGTFAGQLGFELAAAGKEVTLWMAWDKVSQLDREGEAPGRLHVYGGAISPLFYEDHYFQTIIFNPSDCASYDGPVLDLVQEWERLLAPNGRLLIVCPLDEAPHGFTPPLIVCMALLCEAERRFYLREVEIKNGYLRAAAIKRHRDRSRLTSKEWRDLLEMGMFGERRRTWHDQLKQAERKIVQLTREKEELKRRLAPFESSLLWKAAKRFSRNSPDRDRASVHNHSASLRNEAPNIPSSTADPDSTEASVSLPASVQITPKLVAAPDGESHKANGQGHQVSREQVLEEAWVRYLDRVKQMKPERWVMILSSPTYWQNSLHQRTWQLAGALQAEGIPVVLVCEEGAPGEEWIPAYTGSPCIELPRSVFEQKAHEWLSADPGCRQKVLIITQPELLAAKLLNLAKIRGWQIVYDAALDWEALSRWETIPIYSPAVEQYLLYHADLVTAVTPALKAKLKRFRPEDRLLVVPNGSTGEGLGSNEIQTGLQGVEPDKSQEASGGEDSKNPVANRQVCIGYWGPLDKPWLDWETLFMLAKQRPTWRFELVETERTNRDRLPVIGWPYNIRVYGKRSVQEVLKLSSRWQAALYPFFDRELAQGSDLATLNLLLAQGIPVVCLGADPESASPLRMVVEEKEEALAMLEQAISQAGQASPVSRSRDLTRTQAMSQTQAMIQDPGQKEADAHHCLSGWPNHLAELWKKLEREHPQVWDLFPEGETGL